VQDICEGIRSICPLASSDSDIKEGLLDWEGWLNLAELRGTGFRVVSTNLDCRSAWSGKLINFQWRLLQITWIRSRNQRLAWTQCKTVECMCRFWTVLTMFYNTQDYWVFGLRPSASILKNTTCPKLDLFPSSGEGVEDTYFVGSVTKSQ
jgi:hypothetical protein